MDDISPSDLKTILHSKRANLYYLQHCRVLVNGGRVEYVTEEGKQSLYWNIPIANTTCLLFGTGTSVTQAAMRELAKAGVLVGFRKANIGPQNTCSTGSVFGSTTQRAWPPPRPFKLCAWGKLKSTG